MTDKVVLRSRLAEAEEALHLLSIGERAVQVDYEGKKVEYSRASIPNLRAYIRDLKRKLGDPVSSRSRRAVF